MVGQLENFAHGQNLAYVHTGEFDNLYILSDQTKIYFNRLGGMVFIEVPFRPAE
jgi:hypothetical protein